MNYRYDDLISQEPYNWGGAERGASPWDNLDFHLDLGCGRAKKGRLGIDRFWAPEVDVLIDLEELGVPEHQKNIGHHEGSYQCVSDVSYELYADEARRREQEQGLMPGTVLSFGFLPFADDSIQSIITHHCFEHIDKGFVKLMDECYRVLEPGGVLRIIVPLFPSYSAVSDPDHKRYFCVETFDTFCGTAEGAHWMESFSVPYTDCRFEKVDEDYTARSDNPVDWWMPGDSRELRVALRKWST